MLKFQLDSIDDLEDNQKALYEEKDGAFFLKVEGLPEPKQNKSDNEQIISLKNKVDQLLDEKKKEQAKRKEEEKAAALAREEAAKKSGDVEALEKSWQEKFEKLETSKNEEISAMQGAVKNTMVDGTAKALAAEISNVPEVLLPHIKSRIATDIKDGKFVTVVTDADGKPSALTLEELKSEFVGNDAFASIIKKTNASGGGANGSDNSGGGAGQKTITRDKFDQMSHSERATFAKDGGKVVDKD